MAGPDDDLLNEQLRLLVVNDGHTRQIRDLTAMRDINQRRLDEIAAEMRGRQFARLQAAEAAKEG